MDKGTKIAIACVIVGGGLSLLGSDEPQKKEVQKQPAPKVVEITLADRIKSVSIGTKWTEQNNFCKKAPINNGLDKDRFSCEGKLPVGAKTVKHRDGNVRVRYGIDSNSIVQSSVVMLTDGAISSPEELLDLLTAQYGEASVNKGQSFLQASIVYGNQQHDITTAIYGGCKAYFFDRPGDLIKGGRTSDYQNLVDELHVPLSLSFANMDSQLLDHEVVKGENLGDGVCTVATVAEWTKPTNKLGEEDRRFVRAYIAQFNKSLPKITADHWK